MVDKDRTAPEDSAGTPDAATPDEAAQHTRADGEAVTETYAPSPAPADGAAKARDPEPAVESTSPADDHVDEAATRPVVAPSQEPASEATPAADGVDRFAWHPEYRGRSVEDVRQELREQIAADQRQYAIAMDGAEEAESDALASVVSLERKWGPYDFGWAEEDAAGLADRIVDFERERDRRQEMVSWGEYREQRPAGGGGMTDSGELPPAELSTSMKAISLGLVVLLIIAILLAVWAL